jgi:hypothetical protein
MHLHLRLRLRLRRVPLQRTPEAPNVESPLQ